MTKKSPPSPEPKPKQLINKIQFTQEGTKVVFFPVKDATGWEIGVSHFRDCCEYEACADACIVPTQSLQEMGFSYTVGD